MATNPRTLAGCTTGARRAATLRQTPAETARRIVAAIRRREAEGRAWAMEDFTTRGETVAAVWTLFHEASPL